jgi:hypothetical protein
LNSAASASEISRRSHKNYSRKKAQKSQNCIFDIGQLFHFLRFLRLLAATEFFDPRSAVSIQTEAHESREKTRIKRGKQESVRIFRKFTIW